MLLRNGKEIPNIGLGTWMIKNKIAPNMVKEAVKLGYRHFDTARVYFNEKGVGKGVLSCGVPRNEIFVTSKYYPFVRQTYKSAKTAIDRSLKRAGLAYFDLMLIHWPKPQFFAKKDKTYFKQNLDIWRAFEDAYKEGKLKAIGVSNFEIPDLENLMEHADIKPMVNQIKVHIGHTPLKLMTYCQANDIVVEAYSPIARGNENDRAEIAKIAKKYKVSVPQLFIKYTLDLGLVTLPKTSNPDHMRDNLKIDFKISKDDIEYLKTIKF